MPIIALEAKYRAVIKPIEMIPIFELSINESTNFIRFSLCTFKGITSVINPCNWILRLLFEMKGKLGISVNRNKKEGGIAIIKLYAIAEALSVSPVVFTWR